MRLAVWILVPSQGAKEAKPSQDCPSAYVACRDFIGVLCKNSFISLWITLPET